MSKELEALERLYKCNDDDYTLGYQQHDYNLIKQCLERLEAIESADPSEASIDTATKILLTELEMLSDCAVAIEEEPSSNWIEYAKTVAELDLKLHFAYLDIKQALLKAQKDEKIILAIEDYLNQRIGIEPIEDVKKAFLEIQKQLQIIKEISNEQDN